MENKLCKTCWWNLFFNILLCLLGSRLSIQVNTKINFLRWIQGNCEQETTKRMFIALPICYSLCDNNNGKNAPSITTLHRVDVMEEVGQLTTWLSLLSLWALFCGGSLRCCRLSSLLREVTTPHQVTASPLFSVLCLVIETMNSRGQLEYININCPYQCVYTFLSKTDLAALVSLDKPASSSLEPAREINPEK